MLGIALRVLLVIVVVNVLVAAFGGGRAFFVPWLILPLAFLLFCTGTFGGWHGHHRDIHGRRARRESRPEPVGDRDGEREHQLEADLAAARRQVRELEAQLSWQARLLETPARPEFAQEAKAPQEQKG